TLNATNNILTVGIENGNDLTVDLSGLVADGSETIVTGGGINVVTGSGTTLDPYVITATEVDGSITNEVNTAFAVVGSDLSITDSNGTLTVPLSSLGTDDQNIDVLTLNATNNILTVGIENGNDLTVDLSGLVADGSETIVTGGGINVVTGSGTTLDPYVITATEVDGSITNEVNTAFAVVGSDLSITDSNGTLTVPLSSLGTDDQNIDVLTLNATNNILTVGIENGNDLTVDLSGLVADGSETIVTGGGINVVTGSGTTLDPYVITATEVDGSITNEVNTAFAVVGSDLSITDSNGTLTVPLSSLGTDDQKIDKFTLNGTTLELSAENDGEADKTIDLNTVFATDTELSDAITASEALDLDKVVGNEVTGATNGTLLRSGSGTTGSPYTLAVATSGITSNELSANSVTTAKILNGTILTEDVASGGNDKVLVTSNAGIVEWIDKSALVPSTTVSNTSNVNTLTTTVNGVTGSGVNIINSNALSLSGANQLTSTVNGVSSPALNLSSFLDNTDSQTLSTNATPGYIAITGGNNVTLNVNDADSNIGNEYNTDFAVGGGNLTITDGGGARSVPLSSLGSDDQTLTLVGNDLTIESGNTITLPSPDGTETLVTAGNDISVTGDGSSATPYVIANTRPNIFYPPSIAVDASSTGTGRTIDLHSQYTAQFGSPMVASDLAPGAIPTYANTELYYYVTFYDDTVFDNVSVDEFGVMTYDVIATPTDYNSLINVVFVVK
ncbi:hypothetical protein, partial [Arenibacter sp. ARW7G5Y1]|uniref:beta strand repeat-containing protein n=2 Tax=unclassified Arenibacter TaxID=2615047 RepID=UPI000D995853